MTLIDRLGGNLPRGPVTVELDDIQATVLRYRPEPYYGTHVMLHVEDARAGRELLRRLTPHVDSAADWWQAGEPWIAVAISYAGLVALGVPEDSLQSFPEAFRVGMAARADELLDYGAERSGELGAAVRDRRDPHRGQRLQRLRGDVAPHHGDGAAAVRGALRRHGADDAGLRRPAGRPQPARLQGFDRSARHRGQWRRAVARPGTGRSRPASSSSATRARPACRCRCHSRTCWDETARSSGCASTSRASGRSTASCTSTPQTEQERELLAAKLVGPLAQRRAVDARADAGRPGARRRPAPQQRLHLRRRSARPAGAARLAHAAHEPARHRDGAARRREHPPHHPAQHDLRGALRPERDLASRTTRSPRGLYFIFISAKAMATMEFLQQEWINNGNFMSLGDERDPNVGLQEDGATFTIPRRAGQAPHPRHPDVQRAARRRVLLHALPVGLEMDRRPPPAERTTLISVWRSNVHHWDPTFTP